MNERTPTPNPPQQVLQGFPSLVPFLLVSVALLLSMVAVLLVAVGIGSIDEEASHTAVVLGYIHQGCDRSALVPDQEPKQAWFVDASDRCEVASMAGEWRAYAPTLYMRAWCTMDAATSTTRLVLSMGETVERCESATPVELMTGLHNDTSVDGSCIPTWRLLGNTQAPVYMTGICVPRAMATGIQSELDRLRAAKIAGDGSIASMGLTPFDKSTEGFNPDTSTIRVRAGSDESALTMQAFYAVRTIGFASPARGDVVPSSNLGALTTAVVSGSGGRPLASIEHSDDGSSNRLSARGFSFSHSVVQNASDVTGNPTLTAGVVPLVRSPLRYLGADATVFDFGQLTRFTLNFWMRAGRGTRGYVLAVANDWHRSGDAGSSVMLDALSQSMSRGPTSGSIESLVDSPHFKVYSAVSVDGPTSLLTLRFGEGLDGGVSWDLSRLRGLGDQTALDGEWHMITIQSDVSSGWQYFHLHVDSQTSYGDPAWHQCTPKDSSFSQAAPPGSGAVIRVPATIAGVSLVRSDATVAYVGYGFGGGAGVAALQVFTNSANGDTALRSLSAPGMTEYQGGQLVLAVVLFGAVLVGAIIAGAQLLYHSRMGKAKERAAASLNEDEQDRLRLVMRARSKKAGKKAAQTAVSAGVQMSKMYSSVRQLSVENGGSAVSRLRTIYPQFVAVCQAMAIYLTSWGWPEVFSDFANQMTFLFSFRFDLEFPSVPSIVMPIAQFILCGMLLVLAVFLTLHDQKQFYLTAMGAASAAVVGLEKDADGVNDDEDEEDAQHTKQSNNSLPDNYDFFKDVRMANAPKVVFEEVSFSNQEVIRRGPEEEYGEWNSNSFESRGFCAAVKDGREDGLAEQSDVPKRLLDVRPHTRFRVVKDSWLSQEGSNRHTTLRTEPIYTFALLKTNRHGAKPTRDGVGWYEWRCSEGIAYTPRSYSKDSDTHPLFTVRISELLGVLQDANDVRGLHSLLEDTEVVVGNQTTLCLPVYLVKGSHERATASSPNWHESSIPDVHGGMPPPTSLATYDFDAFMQTVSLSAHRAGLHLERGILKFVRDPVSQKYTFEFHCIEVIKGVLGGSSKLPTPQATSDVPNPVVYTVAPDKDRTYRCPRHLSTMIPYRRSFHSECVTCSNSYHKDCATYMRGDGRKCSPSIALVCQEETCGYCLCADGCGSGAGWWERVLQRYYGYKYLFWHSNVNYVIGFFILIIGQSLFLPVVQSAAMIATCHVDYQCDYPRCYDQMTIKYGVSLYFAFVALVITLSVMVPFFTYMIVKRKLFLLENRLVPYEGDYESMGLLSRMLVEIEEEDWDLFLLKDSSILRALYEMYEFRYVAIHGVLLVFKIFLLLPVVFLPRNSVEQLALAGGVEVGLLVLLTATDAFINPWMDALARVGSFHQILQVGLVALSRVLEEWVRPIGWSMIGVSVAYIAVLLAVVIHEIVLPYLEVRRARREETLQFQTRNLVTKWLDISISSLFQRGLENQVPIREYFSPDVLSGTTGAAMDLPNPANPTDDDRTFVSIERTLLRTALDRIANDPATTTITIPFTHLLNKAIRTAPKDHYVCTQIADRLENPHWSFVYPVEEYFLSVQHSKSTVGCVGDVPHCADMMQLFFTPHRVDKEDTGCQEYNLKECADNASLGRYRGFAEVSAINKPQSFRYQCPCVFVHGDTLGEYLSVLELRARAIELSPMSAELFYNAAVSLIDFAYPGETIAVNGKAMGVADLLAGAVERSPSNLFYRQRLVSYLCLRVECRANTKQFDVETVDILGETCDVLRVCEQYLDQSPDSADAYVFVAKTMDRLRATSLTYHTRCNTMPDTLDGLKGTRHAMVHGRAVRDSKDVLMFAIDVLRIIDMGVLLALAEALTIEENVAYSMKYPRDEYGDLGLATLFGRACSAVDVLGISMVAHPQSTEVYAEIESAIGRLEEFASYTDCMMVSPALPECVSNNGSATTTNYDSYDSDASYGGGGEDEDTEGSVENDETVYSDSDESEEDPIEYLFGEYSQCIGGNGDGPYIGRVTVTTDALVDDGFEMGNPRGMPASWVLARMGGCVSTLDVIAMEYLRNCHRRDEVYRYLVRLKQQLKSRTLSGDHDLYSYCLQMNVARHPLQIERNSRSVVPEKWCFKEVIEHAISVHPDYFELYEMLYRWCMRQPGAVVGSIRVVMPLSAARRAACDGAGSTQTGVIVHLKDIWGVLVEHDWGNPAVYVKLSENCPPKGGSKSIDHYKRALSYVVPVYLPPAATTLLPPSAIEATGGAHLVEMNSIDALVMALRITPRDGTLYIRLTRAIRREERRRRYMAYMSVRGKEGLVDIHSIVETYFRPNTGGLICLIPMRSGVDGESIVWCDLLDITCMAAEACGIAAKSGTSGAWDFMGKIPEYVSMENFSLHPTLRRIVSMYTSDGDSRICERMWKGYGEDGFSEEDEDDVSESTLSGDLNEFAEDGGWGASSNESGSVRIQPPTVPKKAPPASVSEALYHLLFGTDFVTPAMPTLLAHHVLSVCSLSTPVTHSDIDADYAALVSAVKEQVGSSPSAVQAEVIRRLFLMKAILLPHLRATAPLVRQLSTRYDHPVRLFGKTKHSGDEVLLTQLANNPVLMGWAPGVLLAWLKWALSELDDKIPVGNGTKIRQTVPITLKGDTFTIADRDLYTSCDYALDSTGMPYRRSAEEKALRIPEGHEITLLMVGGERAIRLYLRQWQKERCRIKEEVGEERTKHGEWSEAWSLNVSSEDDEDDESDVGDDEDAPSDSNPSDQASKHESDVDVTDWVGGNDATTTVSNPSSDDINHGVDEDEDAAESVDDDDLPDGDVSDDDVEDALYNSNHGYDSHGDDDHGDNVDEDDVSDGDDLDHQASNDVFDEDGNDPDAHNKSQ